MAEHRAALCMAALVALIGTAPRARLEAQEVAEPPIVSRPIPFGPERKAETGEYVLRHYGLSSGWRLDHPQVIVEHFTASDSLSSAFAIFSRDVPDTELHQLPATCAHFVIDRDGTIYQLVPLDVVCRHTVGLNWTAIGIEHVGTSDAEILRNPRQLRASLELTLWLSRKYGIGLANVIGHAESLSSPFHRELYAPWRCQTHRDWVRADMERYRAELAELARSRGMDLGAGPEERRPPGC